MYKLIVAGCRHYNDYLLLGKSVSAFMLESGLHTENTEIVSGGAKGADALGERYAKEFSLPLNVFEANWKQYGRAAGPIRNQQMAEYSTHLLAFLREGSKGTRSMIKIATKKGLKIKVISI